MNVRPANIYLESCLEPFRPHLERDDVTDIYVNRPGELWREILGGKVERLEAPELTRSILMRLAHQVAAVTAQGINREHPILSASLPTGERVQIIIPPATRGEVAIAIRKHCVAGLALEDYQDSGAFGQVQVITADHASSPWADADEVHEPMQLLRKAVRERRNILVSGGTSSGKTTFLSALLREIPVDERLILIEDTPELTVVQENCVGLVTPRSALGEAAVTAEDLLIASLRMRPDRIILGEIRGSEAVTFLRAVNTGHPGSLTSIHADSPLRAIDQMALLVLQTGMQMRWDDVTTYIRRSLDLIVQLERGPQGRRVGQILLCR
ncbi:P-type DNA transfer ATPase VirB11 [Sphingobium sufflavum]|uniref:P-type DNA transfer ATPase VirB11 n=1 Tax=Sphingobium sufflavum TaxID=1129547 RepID=UPI001F2EE2C7|nr:P-type DNA transfer ATPase VirB11 [Sphingobium sufflavum]MCE7798375.1 P-type DNA transfer ATPase VirB11 [Sphingobium sufflavum]